MLQSDFVEQDVDVTVDAFESFAEKLRARLEVWGGARQSDPCEVQMSDACPAHGQGSRLPLLAEAVEKGGLRGLVIGDSVFVRLALMEMCDDGSIGAGARAAVL